MDSGLRRNDGLEGVALRYVVPATAPAKAGGTLGPIAANLWLGIQFRDDR